MAKIMQEVKLSNPSITLYKRSDLKEFIREHWLGKTTSHIGCGVISFKEGRLCNHAIFYRKDLVLVQYFGICNVFIEADGRIHIDLWDKEKTELDGEDKVEIKTICDKVMQDNAEYWRHETDYLKWLQLNLKKFDGLTPEEAIALLDQAGF